MSQESVENAQPDEARDLDEPGRATGGAEPKLVPVAESIKYRRRAQQAEERLQQVEQQLKDVQQQVQQRADEIAQAQAQRDDAKQRIVEMRNRLLAQRLMSQAGVIDAEAAWTLLQDRMDLGKELDEDAIARGVEGLLLDKPFLRQSPHPPVGPATASARAPAAARAAQLAQAADRAARSGGRKDIANYLRLRRQAAPTSGPAKR
jgi:small-conductance mechanosensitive channel